MKQNGLALQYASENLRKDKNLILAVKQDLRKDKECYCPGKIMYSYTERARNVSRLIVPNVEVRKD